MQKNKIFSKTLHLSSTYFCATVYLASPTLQNPISQIFSNAYQTETIHAPMQINRATASKLYALLRMAICVILYQSQGW